jgi:hypothetical protein
MKYLISLVLILIIFKIEFAYLKSNGCGASYFNINKVLKFINEDVMISCCNDHDDCYEACSGKSICDLRFLNCMNDVCQSLSELRAKACKVDAQIFYNIVSRFGQRYYCKAK